MLGEGKVQPRLRPVVFPVLIVVGQHRELHAGMLAVQHGDQWAARHTGVSRRTVTYWRKKMENPTLHEMGWGGARNWAMCPDQHALVEGMLWQMVEDLPSETPRAYAALLNDLDIPVTQAWVARCLRRWNYTRKKINHTQALKFTILNVARYLDHVLAAPHLNPTNLKYLDESRVETRRVRRRTGYSGRGQEINATAGLLRNQLFATCIFFKF